MASASTEALLERLLRHPLPEVDLSLTRITRFLERLGNPERRLPPVVHVAGTNGKGSLIAYLRAMLEAADYRCHVYTSPHLVRFHERIVVAGREIPDAALRDVLARVVRAGEDFLPMTFFESVTAAAFLAFTDTPADLVLLEVGMGGRLDATNVIPRPLLTAITPVSFDHMDFLGDTLAKIAGEKAGIIKSGVPCVLGPQEPEALAVQERRAAEMAAPLSVYGRDYHMEGKDYRSPALRLEGLAPSLPGQFQLRNAAIAAACAEVLRDTFSLEDAHIRHGIANAHWPARLQKLEGGALNAVLGAGRALWLDGGHNPAAGEALAAWQRERGGKIHLILGMLKGKDARGYVRPLLPHLASLTVVSIEGEEKSAAPEALLTAAVTLGLAGRVAESVEVALAQLAEGEGGEEVLIGGSLYLAGEVLEKNAVQNAGR